MKNLARATILLLLTLCLRPALAHPAPEDGYDLWLRYRPLASAAQTAARQQISAVSAPGLDGPTAEAALAELDRGLAGLLGKPVSRLGTPRANTLVLATPRSLPALAELHLPLEGLGPEGYLLRHVRLRGVPVTLIAANTDIGLLYGSFALLRALGTGVDLATLDQSAAPALQLRVLNHWDNLDRSVERGYAGQSIWNWWALPDIRDARYIDYARANASLGINGSVLNNVNAKAEMLSAPWIAKAAALADTLRPYGIKVYLSVRWSTPLELGETKSADPLSPEVRAWWKAKADEIYRTIPDFGGFLVKANSEGQPGPQDYHRNHVDGANMLAEALAPHKGIVMWRAFVYADDVPADRAKQAYDQFKPLDGQFAPNVVVQVKNGPIDFQPREPFHPLFGAMPHTALMMEFQITKEYLGFATHQAYLGSLFEEVLQTDTRRRPHGAKVADVLEGRLSSPGLTGMAGVTNIGSERNWSGSHFDQANWYAFGRLAWDPHASAKQIAREWIEQTWTREPQAVASISEMMMGSREAVVDYMTPLGLHHLMGTGHHFGPAPWVADLKRPEWNPAYYHRADKLGIGFERGAAGSDAISQYAPELAAQYANVATTPPELLLWFHHVPWNHAMPSGRTLWNELIAHYERGVASVAAMQVRWAALAPDVDPRRHAEVAALLAKQHNEALLWRDASIAYFQSVSRLPLPAGVKPPPLTLEQYKAMRYPFAPGNG
jgi:alpha-glucuronidase